MKGTRRERRPGVFQLRVHAGGGRWETRTHYGSATSADKALRNLVAEVEDGRHEVHADPKLTVGEVLERWLTSHEADWAPKTSSDHRATVERLIIPRIGDRPVVKLRPAEIEGLYAELAASGGKADKDGRRGPLGPATLRHVHAHLSAALKDAQRLELISRSPMDRVRPPRQPPKRDTTAVTVDMVTPAIERAIADGRPGMACLVRLALVTGARRGELLALRWSDLDLEGGSVVFARSMSTPGGGPMIEKGTKRSRPKTVAIDPGTVAALRSWRLGCAESALELGYRLTDRWRVWPATPDGQTPWHVDRVSAWWTRLAASCGLEGVRFHDLRHATATTMIAAGIDPAVVASHLGHSTPNITLAVYAAAVPARQRAAADLLGDALGQASGLAGVPLWPPRRRRPVAELG